MKTDPLMLCGLKLIEVLTYPQGAGDPFKRLLKLSQLIETFAECASTEFERDIATGLRKAVDYQLTDAASWSADVDAAAVLAYYGASTNLKLLPPKKPRRYEVVQHLR